jgi:hypothetical protein
MTVQDLEAELLRLSPAEKLRLIQLLAQSLNADVAGQSHNQPEKLSEFFRRSPLAEAVAAESIDLGRDRSLPEDRFVP